MHSSFPAIDGLFAHNNPIYFNLGTIDRHESYQLGPHATSVLPLKPFYGALVETNPGLPRPGRDLDAKLLRVPDGMPLGRRRHSARRSSERSRGSPPSRRYGGRSKVYRGEAAVNAVDA